MPLAILTTLVVITVSRILLQAAAIQYQPNHQQTLTLVLHECMHDMLIGSASKTYIQLTSKSLHLWYLFIYYYCVNIVNT